MNVCPVSLTSPIRKSSRSSGLRVRRPLESLCITISLFLRAARRFLFSAKIPMFGGALPPAEVTPATLRPGAMYLGAATPRWVICG